MPIIFDINNNTRRIFIFNVRTKTIIVIKIDIKIDKSKEKFANVYINIISKYIWHSNGYKQLKIAKGQRHINDIIFDKI